MRHLALFVLIAAFAVTLSACDALSGDAGEARLTVRMTDAPFPFDLAAEANVTITRIELLAGETADDSTDADSTDADDASDDADRIVLYDGAPFALNLLDLRDGVDTTLVSNIAIPADGSYRQLRFYVGDDASVVFFDGRTFDLKLPSAQQSGIKVMLPDFDDADGEDLDVLIDFDIEKSFVVRGNVGSENFNGFLFKPVLEIESFEIEDEETEEDESEEDGSESGSGDGSDG